MYKNSVFLPIWTRPRLQISLNLFAIIAPQLILNAFGIYLLGASVFLPILSICYAALITRKIFELVRAFHLIKRFGHSFYGSLSGYKTLPPSKQKMLSSFVAEMSQQLKMPLPDIYYDKRAKAVNASLLLENWGKYRIVLSKGLLKAFVRDEIEADTLKAIIAHELSHAAHHDAIMAQCFAVISSINYIYASIAVCSIPILTCVWGLVAVFSTGASALSTFFILNGVLSGIVAVGALTYFCSKSIDRAMEFRADLTALELTQDAGVTSRMTHEIRKILSKWGFQFYENMFGYMQVKLLSPEKLLGLNQDLLDQYLRINRAKLKKQKSQPGRFKKFNKLEKAFRNYLHLYKNGFIPLHSIGNAKRKSGKLLQALLTSEQRKAIAVVNSTKLEQLPITPWYDANAWLACWDSFMATHPSAPAREAAILAAAKNKVSVSSKYSRQRL
ncbi:M56 family metallopeptidase [Candidatus Berkiella cookevillensis]|uniref:Heat shock protein HtpX n=1 Tax=Candidatus Berkiella cookevillensis TaxID=437022 RepID=A0A0Q9YHS5_9GAMM|nr:M48 family metalloprotease [Candidatus Berkiella cookevillensis]MCS5708295.1 M56 family metallopeptidase [Candidatus Berkiella cookevillensis]